MQVCAAISDLLDTVVLNVFETILNDLNEAGPEGLRGELALVAHGGYGRRDVAPYSDVDLMILHTNAAAQRVIPVAERMMSDLFDIGLDVGQSIRTVRQALQLSAADATIFTSLAEARYLSGSVNLYSLFARKFQQRALRRAKSLVKSVTAARDEERAQYGETVYLLEPNVKRSRGALRDVQLLRWAGFSRVGVSGLSELRGRGLLSDIDYTAVANASEFLLRLRNELHFHAGKGHDHLDRAEQIRIAEVFGFTGAEGLLPVEQFMRAYFRHTSAVSTIVSRFAATALIGSKMVKALGPLVSYQFERDFRVGPAHISATRRGLAKLQSGLSEILRLADLANMCDRSIDHETCEAVREAALETPAELDEDVTRRFLSLLQQPLRLGELLRMLHEMAALETIIPAFAHARCLLQFNEYHKYTVDEHCLRAVEAATAFLNDSGPLGRAYRRIRRKSILHLALLIHDLGKGYAEDHSEVGLRIASDSARRLSLNEEDAETLKFLVHKHLLLSYRAFRRDINDERVVLEYAREVGSPEVARMLYVLTAADFAAVGPGTLNDWKIDVLTSLHLHAMRRLAGDASSQTPDERLKELRDEVLQRLGDEEDKAWFREQADALPFGVFDAHQTDEIAENLRQLHALPAAEVDARGRYLPESRTVEYTVATHESVTQGVFYKLTGALSSKGLEILSAEIYTLARGLIVDRFVVKDPDYANEPPASRQDEVCLALRQALLRNEDQQPRFRKMFRARQGQRASELIPRPTRVGVDNSSSDTHTVLDIFAHDRTGLLYTIARTLFDLGLSVSVAKISTYVDQVVDVFYVTEQTGQKVAGEERIQAIRDRLLAEIERFEQKQRHAG